MNTSHTPAHTAQVDGPRVSRTRIDDISPVGRTLSQEALQLVAGGARSACGCSKTIDKINTGHPVPDTDDPF